LAKSAALIPGKNTGIDRACAIAQSLFFYWCVSAGLQLARILGRLFCYFNSSSFWLGEFSYFLFVIFKNINKNNDL
jgi:hypothetical protein